MSGGEIKAVVRAPKKKHARVGKGFSRKEISEVGLTLSEARKLGIYIDVRRKSSWSENVEALKRLISGKKQNISPSRT